MMPRRLIPSHDGTSGADGIKHVGLRTLHAMQMGLLAVAVNVHGLPGLQFSINGSMLSYSIGN